MSIGQFDDLFQLVASLGHDYRDGVHSCACRCCAIAPRLTCIKTLVQELEFALGEPAEEKVVAPQGAAVEFHA